jgi:hypothetical protein
MQRHKNVKGPTAEAARSCTRYQLEIARARVESLDQEILEGRWNVRELRDELARMISDKEDWLAGTPLKLQCDHQQSPEHGSIPS